MTMITPSYLGETIEYSSLHACRSTLEDPTGLRAISIVLVILCHTFTLPDFPHYGWLDAIARRGGFGVDIFFVISGFLITWLLLGEESKTGRIVLRQFYVRRAFRILPPAFTYLLFIAVLVCLGKSLARWNEIFSAAFFARNLVGMDIAGRPDDTGHYWSLAIEEQFYLLWPFMLVILPRRWRIPTVIGLILAAPIWLHINFRMFPEVVNSLGEKKLGFNLNRADLRYGELMMGCLLALLRKGPRTLRWLRHPVLQNQITFVLCIALLVFLMSPLAEFRHIEALYPIFSAACIALAINYLVEGRPGLPHWLFNTMPMVWIGQLSFSWYLWQQIFCLGTSGLRMSLPWSIVLSLLTAALSFYVIEQPALRLRGLIMRRSAARPKPRMAILSAENTA